MKRIPIIIAVINLVALLITSVALVKLQGAIGATDAKIARQRELHQMVNDQLRVASNELNFSFVHLTAMSMAETDVPAQNAGAAYVSHLTTLVGASIDEARSNDPAVADAMQELQEARPAFASDFRTAVLESGDLKDRIMRLVNDRIASIQARRSALEAERSELSTWETLVKGGLSALQFFSLFLLLVKELAAKPAVVAGTP